MNKRELISQSIDYMLQHLDAGITIKDVANHFHYSEFYFSRVFKAVMGESVYAFIKHLKMAQSAIDIKLKQHKTITDIGLDYGYSSSNYSAVFSQYHRLSPTKFRKSTEATSIVNPFNPEIIECFETFDDYDARMKIVSLSDVRVIYERVLGNYGELKEKWFQFLETYKDYIRDDTLMIERFYDDPAVSSRNSCICDLCITADNTCKLENITTIKGGKFATYRFEGEITNIFSTLQGIFAVWFPKSGYEMDERYGLNIYRQIDRATSCVIMDLYIPVK
ncbi:MAG TPA: AraC family transcriptional regulator [Bacillota bacterium]|jgi:AraC family transcriptional regulator|nr:AraC family transcriptional regulator [Bacillota bacterium]HOL10426.1 AraC family transcriptional regulator [Bacillota bacterium]HPO96759.1 AraC family transcriptional regulator [Bacillota bacterium]